jgi:hypothetical protein
MAFHIGLFTNQLQTAGLVRLNLDETTMLERFVEPYRRAATITSQGTWVQPHEIRVVQIFETDEPVEIYDDRNSLIAAFNAFATAGRERTDDFIAGPPGYLIQIEQEAVEPPRDPRRVMIVHGRNAAALNALRSFLASTGLEPILWEDAVAETGSGSPHNLEAVEAAMALAQAVVVIFTAEDEGRLIPTLLSESDGPQERELRGQPRANVFLEAGMALAFDRTRTILTRLGPFRGASDVDGLNAVNLGNAPGPRVALRRRLETVGCLLNERTDYLEPVVAGDFDAAIVEPSDPASVENELKGREAAELRVAANEISDELEYVRKKIDEDSYAYWAGYKLPVYKWQLHGSMIARNDDDAHALLRIAYYEIDRVQHCIDNQYEAAPMGEVFLPEDATVNKCEPDKATNAIDSALLGLRELLKR